MSDEQYIHDAFISHASEDKEVFVRPLAEFLQNAGLDIWYDELSLSVGDSLSRSIDKGLAASRFGIVVLSRHFLSKKWPEYELRGLTAKEIEGGKTILPIWLNIEKSEVLKFSPTLADKYALDGSNSIPTIASKLIELIKPQLHSRIHQKLAYAEAIPHSQIRLVDLKKIKNAPIRHKNLSHELMSRIRLIRAALLEVYPLPFSGWVDGFRRDQDPDDEVKTWEKIASAYLECSYGLDHDMRNATYDDVFSVINDVGSNKISEEIQERCTSEIPIEGNEKMQYGPHAYDLVASDDEDGTATGTADSIPKTIIAKLRIDGIETKLSTMGAATIDVREIQSKEVRDLLTGAGLIIGRDRSSGSAAIFYGKETLREFSKRKDNAVFPRPVIFVSYDNRSTELEYLCAAVMVLKGGCCYSGSGRKQAKAKQVPRRQSKSIRK